MGKRQKQTPPKSCRICGCTDAFACEGGCHWVEDPEGLGPLCSHCLNYDGEIALIQSHLNVAFQAIEECVEALEALKIRRREEKDGQFSNL